MLSSPGKLRKLDCLTAPIFIGIGAWIIWQGAHMPWRAPGKTVAESWYLSPGLFPVVVGAGLVIFSLAVLIRAIREGGLQGLGQMLAEDLRGMFNNAVVFRIVVIWLLISVYIFGLLTRVNYYLASSVFLASMMLQFYRPEGPRLRWRNVVVILLVAGIAPLAVGYAFSRWFNVPLP